LFDPVDRVFSRLDGAKTRIIDERGFAKFANTNELAIAGYRGFGQADFGVTFGIHPGFEDLLTFKNHLDAITQNFLLEK